ncbi:MFS transporter, partial [Phenylobacterium sp. Root77]|uniref:MFS transporter n=2 Tax=Phenylobacterium TaxID=20 RepID=UPI003FA77F2F
MGEARAADGRLSVRSKVFYGFGSVAFGVATLGLSSAVLQPYLNRVIGLPALWVGTAIMATLILDAFIDPAIGQWSDKLRTRWGRRHPLMYAAAPLVAVACIAFWNSPADWPPETVGLYLIGMLVLLRLCVSLYEVPSQALAPELSSDYHQRTSLFSYRFFFGVIGGFGMNVVLYQVFLSPENGGILNRDGYAQYGVLAALVMAASILVSAIGTHRHIPHLAAPPERQASLP